MRLVKENSIRGVFSPVMGLFVVLLALAPLLGHQMATGTIVNGVLMLSVVLFGLKNSLPLAAVPSLMAWCLHFLPANYYVAIVPIIISNLVLMLLFSAFYRYNYWVAIALAGFVKFICLFGFLFFLFPQTLGIASYLQLVTVLLGGFVSWSVGRFLNKPIEPN